MAENSDKKKDELARKTLSALKDEYVFMDRSRVRSWTLWLVVGVVAGVIAALIWIASRSV